MCCARRVFVSSVSNASKPRGPRVQRAGRAVEEYRGWWNGRRGDEAQGLSRGEPPSPGAGLLISASVILGLWGPHLPPRTAPMTQAQQQLHGGRYYWKKSSPMLEAYGSQHEETAIKNVHFMSWSYNDIWGRESSFFYHSEVHPLTSLS